MVYQTWDEDAISQIILVTSGGKTLLRSVKVAELNYNANGTIKTLEGTD